MPRENIFNVDKADLEKSNICEFADLASLFMFICLVNIVPPVSTFLWIHSAELMYTTFYMASYKNRIGLNQIVHRP